MRIKVNRDRTRQYGETIDQIRTDHVKRYLFAARRVKDKKVLDLACGCGYGSWLMVGAGAEVTAVDIEPDAIAFGKVHYQGPIYLCQKAEETFGKWDVLVSFETIEHLAAPQVFLANVQADQIICSVPNEEVIEFRARHYVTDTYPHQRHYTPQEFENLLRQAGYLVTEKYCQRDKETGVITPGTNGRFLIYVGVKQNLSTLPAQPAGVELPAGAVEVG